MTKLSLGVSLLPLLIAVTTIGANNSSNLWCPESHQLMKNNGDTMKLCLPMSCVRMRKTAKKVAQKSPVDYQCQKFSAYFKKCQKVYLDIDQFVVLDKNGTLWNKGNTTLQLGNYFQFSNQLVACASEVNSPESSPVPEPIPCMPLEVPSDGYQNQPNSSIFVTSISGTINSDYFTTSSNGSIRACYPSPDFKQIPSCKQIGTISGDEIMWLPDLVLQDKQYKSLKLKIGEYIAAEDDTYVIYCVKDIITGEERKKVAVYLYGIAAIISAVCLLLALLTLSFFPRLNYHTKALLCLAFSLMLSYIALATRYFSFRNQFNLVGNLIIFSIQYIFGLSSFLWLNVMAHDLWRVFADTKGFISVDTSRRKGKRIFYLKCLYAWGIPAILCISIISLQFYAEAQETLNIYLQFEINNWFHKTIALYALFYVPVIVILISNAIYFGLTVRNIRQASSGTEILHADKKMNMKLFHVYIKLFVVMGVFWIADVISQFSQNKTDDVVWYTSDIINALQGFFIFLIYVCKKDTFKIIREKFNCISTAAKSRETSQTPLSTPKTRKISSISLTAVSRNK